jgi:Rha family phage regulatory protein
MSDLVFINRKEVKTNSVIVAEKFQKQHKNVVRKIENLFRSPDFARLNFEPSEYTDSTGRNLKMYIITKKGFARLVMSFTGEKADTWIEDYIEAFNRMENLILQQQNLQWQEDRAIGKVARLQETTAVQKFVDYATAHGSRGARHYYSAFTKMCYKFLFNIPWNTKIPDNFRNRLNSRQLDVLKTAEFRIEEWINEEFKQSDFVYQDAYKRIRDKTNSLAICLGARPFLIEA